MDVRTHCADVTLYLPGCARTRDVNSVLGNAGVPDAKLVVYLRNPKVCENYRYRCVLATPREPGS